MGKTLKTKKAPNGAFCINKLLTINRHRRQQATLVFESS